MISLFIDTCTSNLVVALLKNDKILSIYNEHIEKDLSTQIFPVLQDIFNRANIIPEQVDTIFIVNGPGSFTGIRIGVTIAKTYAWTLNKKIIPISRLEVMATTTSNKDYIVPIIDARRQYVYAGIYNEHLDFILNDQYISIEELKNKLLNHTYDIVSFDDIENILYINPQIDILKIIKKHKNDLGINPHQLKPNYLKLTEAEMNLKND